ncbi:MAG: hypothetical protein HFF36_10600 [Coprobacillus sp.]|nr:hypothetical protein [Coprobacillus sp.]
MKQKKLDKLKVITLSLTVVLIMMIPTFNRIANQTRNEPGYGGECLAWIIPSLLYFLFKTIKDILRGERKWK